MNTLRTRQKTSFYVTAVLVLLLAGFGLQRSVHTPVAVAAATRPNVIVILADDLGYADISAYKIDRFQTPNVDRIGMQGVRFTDAYATAPVCGPSRAGLMTGRYQDRFGYEYNLDDTQASQGLGMSVGEITIAQLMKQAGYHTGMIGKWHLGSASQFYPTSRGFDEFVGFLPGETSYMDPMLPGVHASYGPLGDDALLSKDPPAIEDEDRPQRLQRIRSTFVRQPKNDIIEGPDRHVVHNEQEYLTDYFGDRATEYIRRNVQAQQPYFLYLAFNAVHAPHMVTAKYYDRFANIQDHQLRVYAAMVAALDDNVGRVLDAVQASGQANNTIIYFASDNGCAAYFPGLCSCTPLRGGKLSHYEGGTRVPLMIRWPGHIPAGLVYREVASLTDILPTSVAAGGGHMPQDRIYDGVNLMPYLSGTQKGPPHDMLAWRRLPLFSIRQGDWKLWESVDDKTGVYGQYKLLFNLKADLNETTNLADKNPAKVKQLEGLAHEWAKSLTAPQWPSRKPVTYDVCGTPFTLPI